MAILSIGRYPPAKRHMESHGFPWESNLQMVDCPSVDADMFLYRRANLRYYLKDDRQEQPVLLVTPLQSTTACWKKNGWFDDFPSYKL